MSTHAVLSFIFRMEIWTGGTARAKQQGGLKHFCKVAPRLCELEGGIISHTKWCFWVRGLEHRMLNMCLKKDPALIVRDKDNNSQLLWHREIMMKSSPQQPPASTPLFSYKVCSHYGQHFEKRQLNSLTNLCQNYNFLSMDIICLWEEACQINPMISNQLIWYHRCRLSYRPPQKL